MNKKLLFVGAVFMGGFFSLNAAEVINYVLVRSNGAISSRIDYTYDANGLVTEELVTVPDIEDPSAMVNFEKTSYGYDSQNRRNVVEQYVWNDNTYTFEGRPVDGGARAVYTFDEASGRVAEQHLYDWGVSGWNSDYSVRCLFEYEGNNGTENRYKKINGIDQADPYEINEYIYDDNWNVLQKIRNMNDFFMGVVPDSKEVYGYDEKGNVVLEEKYMYSGGGGDIYDPWGDAGGDSGSETAEEWTLLERHKYEYEYNADGNVSRKVTSVWRDYLDDYEVESDLTYEYFYGSNDALELDYANNFDAENAFDGFVTEDGNNDGEGWRLENGVVTCTSSQASEAPEILYLPALRLTTENEVEVIFKAKVADAAKPGKLQMILCSNDEKHTVLGPIGQIWNITGTEYQEIKGLIVPEKADAYVIGICFDNNQTGAQVIIDELEVKNGRSTATPSAPFDFTATPATDGSLQVQLIWYAPNTDIAGNFINHADKMELYREGVEEPVYTTEAVGATLAAQYIDQSIPEKGEYTYRVYAYLNGLKSDAAVVKVKVGYPVPPALENLKVVENDDHTVTLSWDAPAEEYGDVKYYIVRNNEVELATAFEGTTFVDNTIDVSAGQTFVFYFVQSYNEIGYNRGTTSELLFVGEPSGVPFKESFAGGVSSHQWMNEVVNGYDAAWGTGSGTTTNPSAEPQDGDGGLAAFLSTILAEGDAVRFTSEKIDISSLAEPELTFHMYLTDGELTGDALVVEASKDNGEYEILSDPFNVSGNSATGWVKQSVSLDKFKGERNVRLSFRGVSAATYDILIDNIVVDNKDNGGADEQFAATAKVYAADGEIIINALEESDIHVYNMNGVQVYAGRGLDARIQAEVGMYIVTVDGVAVKVAVM